MNNSRRTFFGKLLGLAAAALTPWKSATAWKPRFFADAIQLADPPGPEAWSYLEAREIAGYSGYDYVRRHDRDARPGARSSISG